MHRNVARARVAFEAVQDREAIDVGQIDVKDDGRRQIVARQRQGRISLVGDDGLEVLFAGIFHHFQREAFIVFDDQHRRVTGRDQAPVVQDG